MTPDPAASRPTQKDPRVVLAGLLGVGLLWFFWPTLGKMAHKWSTDARYSHGYIVPAFALALLWLRRERLASAAARPSWGGLALVGAALALGLAGAYFYLDFFEALALLPALAGLCVLAAGWASLRWSWPAIAFLVFMVPLPFRVEGALANPLQRVATKASTYALQTLGFPALASGNVIHLDHADIGVVEACSGLSMLFTFFAVATGVVMVIRRPWPDKLVVVASAVPIALAVNVARITVTGALHETVSSKVANVVFHDLAGWIMMPTAVALLWFELEMMARVLVEPGPAAVGRRPSDPAAARAPREHSEGGSGHNASEAALKRMLGRR